LPDPGAPSNTMRMRLLSAREERGTFIAN